jgi:peroxidase
MGHLHQFQLVVVDDLPDLLLRLLVLLTLAMAAATSSNALDAGYYAATCPDAEAIVSDAMSRLHYKDPTLAPALIRLLFHDCSVRGCDASVLISPTPRYSSERTAIPNHTLRGFNAVDAVKRALEAACPGAVSCADALALMARDSVALLGGARYGVALGRRDGTQSNPWEVDLPAPFAKLDDVLAYFSARGFSAEEAVVLLGGGHTVGGAHCGSFRYRLTDPNCGMDEAVRRDMLDTCGAADQPLDTDPAAFLDPDTPFAVDNNFYAQLMGNRTLLQVDQEAATHHATAPHVAYYAASNDAFLQRFSEAMEKLSNVGVLEGDAGEVRKVCSRYNT